MSYVIYIGTVVTALYLLLLILIVIGFIKGRANSSKRKDYTADVRYSIVVPYRNEEDVILRCLNALSELEYPKELIEIILVDDASDDRGPSQVLSFKNEHAELNLHCLALTEGEGKKAALTHGISHAKHDYVVTTDADCVVPTRWLSSLTNQYQSGAEMVISPVQLNAESGFFGAFQQLDFFALQGVSLGGLVIGLPSMNNGANLSFEKKVFNQVSGYDNHPTPSGDDVFLMEKYLLHGKKVRANIDVNAIVATDMSRSWHQFFQQRIRWASKTKYYKRGGTVVLGILMLLSNLFLLFFYSGALLVEKYRNIMVILALTKWLIDFILLFLVASFYRQKKVLWFFLPVQLMYPFYILAIWITSLTASFKWKGRRYYG